MNYLVQIPLFRLAAWGTLLLLSSLLSEGSVYRWDADGDPSIGTPGVATPGNGTWSTSVATWNNASSTATDVVWANGNTVQFGSITAADGTYAIAVDPSVTNLVNSSGDSIAFNSSGFVLSATSAVSIAVNGAVTVGSGKTATIGNNITLTSVTNSAASGRLILAGGSSISSNGTADYAIGNLEIQTGATLSLGGRTLVNGGSTQSLWVNGGSMTFDGATMFLGQASGNDMTTTLSAGGQITATSANSSSGYLQFGSTNGTITSSGTFNLDAGTFTIGQIKEGGSPNTTSTFNLNGGTIKVKANTSLGSTFLTGLDTANVRNGGAKFDTNGVNITVGQALVHSTIGGDNATDGGLTKSGTGTLTLSGASTFTGATTINAGTLTLSSTGTIDNSSGVAVASGATFNTSAKTSGYTVKGLSGAGTVVGLSAQALTLATGGVLAAGDAGIGTLTFTAGNLALADGTTLNYQIGGTTAVPTSDLVQLTGSGSTVTFTGTQTLLLANLGTVDPTGKTFTLFDSAASISIAGTWIIDYGSTGWTGGSVSLASGNVVLSGLSVSAIPEPSTSAALLGVAVLGPGLLRRRRQPLIA